MDLLLWSIHPAKDSDSLKKFWAPLPWVCIRISTARNWSDTVPATLFLKMTTVMV
jgi:hypothetical protein